MNKLSVHSCQTTGKKIHPSIDELCFNHYKIDFSKHYNKYKIMESNINQTILQKIQNNSKNYEVCRIRNVQPIISE
jgi:hypothetical protein